MRLSEKQIEDVFAVYHEQLIESNLKLIGRQYSLENKLRVDLLFKDKKGKNLALELKKDAITREDVGQTLQYAGLIKDSRIILAAPIIASSIKTAFEHYGIEYIEFSLTEIEKLYHKLQSSPKEKIRPSKLDLPKIIHSEPLESRTLVDGNIAFKVTYNDSNWYGVCSEDVYRYNVEHRTWCGIQADNKYSCRHKQYKDTDDLDLDFLPCYESIVLKELSFSPGINHGPKLTDIPRRCLDAKKGKFAIFTSREPGESENERFIFAIGVIQSIYPSGDIGASERFVCDKKTALIFGKNNYPKYWKYYKNPNTDRVAWNTGLFRYINDKTVRQLLQDIQRYTDKTLSSRATELLKILK